MRVRSTFACLEPPDKNSACLVEPSTLATRISQKPQSLSLETTIWILLPTLPMAEELNPFNTPLKSRVPFGHQKMIITNKDRHLASGNCQSKSFFFFIKSHFSKLKQTIQKMLVPNIAVLWCVQDLMNLIRWYTPKIFLQFYSFCIENAIEIIA